MNEKERTPRPAGTSAERKCPICGKPASKDASPFCSRGCANIDLNRWLSGRYVIPAAADEPAEGDDVEK